NDADAGDVLAQSRLIVGRKRAVGVGRDAGRRTKPEERLDRDEVHQEVAPAEHRVDGAAGGRVARRRRRAVDAPRGEPEPEVVQPLAETVEHRDLWRRPRPRGEDLRRRGSRGAGAELTARRRSPKERFARRGRTNRSVTHTSESNTRTAAQFALFSSMNC